MSWLTLNCSQGMAWCMTCNCASGKGTPTAVMAVMVSASLHLAKRYTISPCPNHSTLEYGPWASALGA